MAEYRLQFLVEPYTNDDILNPVSKPTPNDITLDLLVNHTYPKMWRANEALGIKRRSVSALKLLSGASAGKEIHLAKPLTTLGKIGLQVAAVAEYSQGYYCLSHVEGKGYPRINGRSIGTEIYRMSHGDVIDLAGTRIRFLAY